MSEGLYKSKRRRDGATQGTFSKLWEGEGGEDKDGFFLYEKQQP